MSEEGEFTPPWTLIAMLYCLTTFKMLLKGLRMFSYLVMAFCGAIWSAFNIGEILVSFYTA